MKSNAPVSVVASQYNASTYWYMVSTIVFMVVKVINLPTGEEILGQPSNNIVSTVIYVVCIIFVMIYFNSTSYREKCGLDEIKPAGKNIIFIMTIFPWVSVLGMIFALLSMKPGWKTPFSNTFGYLITIFMMGGLQKFRSLIADGDDKALLNNNIGTLINEFNPGNLHLIKNGLPIKLGLKSYNSGGGTAKTYIQIAKLVYIKDYIAETIWYILCGLIVINLTNNYIMEQNCS